MCSFLTQTIILCSPQQQADAAQLANLNGKAARLADDFQEQMADTCPHCSVRFDSYDACNSVTCVECRNHFCGLCLTKGSCSVHGHSFGGYEEALAARVERKFKDFVKGHFASSTDSREFRLFANRLADMGVKAAIQAGGKAGQMPQMNDWLGSTAGGTSRGPVDAHLFLQSCREDIANRLREERESMRVGGQIRQDCQVPEGYRVTLVPDPELDENQVFHMQIYMLVTTAEGAQDEEEVKLKDLPDEDDATILLKSIRTALIVDGTGTMYQTQRKVGTCGMVLVPRGVDRVGFGGEVRVMGILGNARLIAMRDHLESVTAASLCGPVKALLGAAPNMALVTELAAQQHPLTKDLNEYQLPVVDMTRLRAAQVRHVMHAYVRACVCILRLHVCGLL